MTEEKKAEIKSLILENIDKLNQKIDDLKELTKPIAPENAIGRVSRMDAINNKSVNEAALRNSEAKLQNMILALKRLEEEENFGLCQKCGQAIIAGRIVLMPESPYCTPCASKM